MDYGVCLNKKRLFKYNGETYDQMLQIINKLTKLSSDDYYLTQNGKLYTESNEFNNSNCNIQIHIRINGGKGGFGSMLRAIGAQIEKTTNKEACRDLSGRRLRDINEEKKLKAWLEKQKEREEEAKERKKRKIAKLTAVPKHEFKDTRYEKARSELVENLSESVEEGFKKAQALNDAKRKAEVSTAVRKRPCLWIGDDMSSGSDSSDSDSEKFKGKISQIIAKENKSDDSESSQSSLSNKSNNESDSNTCNTNSSGLNLKEASCSSEDTSKNIIEDDKNKGDEACEVSMIQ